VEWYLYAGIVAAGFLAGFINTLAGSGSLITLPLLIFAGLPVPIANGTNRVAILFQNVVGVSGFYKQKILDVRGVMILGVPAFLGSIVGAQIAVNLDEALMRKAIGMVMILMLVIILFRPNRWLQGDLEIIAGMPSYWKLVVFFLIGIYGGFIQAGVGIFLLAGLVLGIGYDLVRANAVKVGIVLVFTMAALSVFVINGQVDWFVGLILAIGNMLGAWSATKFAAEKGTVWVRRLLIAVIIISAASLLDIYAYLQNLI
jgi:hypothetical protein